MSERFNVFYIVVLWHIYFIAAYRKTRFEDFIFARIENMFNNL